MIKLNQAVVPCYVSNVGLYENRTDHVINSGKNFFMKNQA